jgi:prepilin-type N-terminal cleavage/methylation domain-containing protein
MRMDTLKNTHFYSKAGFSLIELLLALATSTIVLVAIYSVFTITNKNFTTQNVAANVQQSLRSAVGLMARDIRLAGMDPVDTDRFGIAYASQTKIRFTQDSIDSGTGEFNGTVDEANFEEVTYELQSNQIIQTLYETVTTSSPNSAVLIRNITNLNFAYLDAANHDLVDYGLSPPRVPNDKLADIRSVKISITIQEPAGRDEPVNRTLTRKVECRNLGFN